MFLHERAFDDILERLGAIRRQFESALLIGCPDPAWVARVPARHVAAVDPGPVFAQAAGGQCVVEDSLQLDQSRFDLCIAVGTLDSVNDLPSSLRTIRQSLKPDSLLIGAIPGNDSLPRLRAAMRAADEVVGSASPHIHPRLEAPTVAQLLASCGFQMPVVDVDRVLVSYRSLQSLISDLRDMGATNCLLQRSRRPLLRSAAKAAGRRFLEDSNDDGRVVERFELIHFAAWTAPADQS